MSDRNTASPPKPRRYACTECSSRKIRCDRSLPCGHCHNTNLKCRYVAPPPPRRKPALSKSKDRATRLAELERTVERLEYDGKKKARTSKRHTVSPEDGNVCQGLLVGEGQGKSRYLEMPVMISLSQTIDNSSPGDDDNDEDDWRNALDANKSNPESGLYQGLIFGHHEHLDLTLTQPGAGHRQYLWLTFLKNCHPVLKIFDPATTGRIMSQASNSKRHTAFLLAIYSLAILSMEDVECEAIMAVSREGLLQAYHRATEQALAAVDVLATTDMMVLQAFVMYIFFIQAQTDHSKLWSLTGLAVRIAQRIGLHRDGISLGLGATDTELRRRLWWQLLLLDTCTAEVTGSRGTLNEGWDTKMPSFYCGTDLGAAAAPLPQPDAGQPRRDSEMIYSLVRFEIFNFLRTVTAQRSATVGDPYGGGSTGVPFLFDSSVPRAEREGVLDSLEGFIFSKYLSRAQPPDSPMHVLACDIAQFVITRLRLLAIYPQRDKTVQAQEDSGQRDRLLHLCIKCLDTDAHIHSASALKPFRWHLRGYFQWAAFLGLLMELLRRGRQRTERRDEDDRAWKCVGEVYEVHPEFLADRGQMLHRSAARLALMAWEAREKKGATPPDYIQILKGVYAGGTVTPQDGLLEGEENMAVLLNDESIWLTQHDMLAHMCNDVDGLWAGSMFAPTYSDRRV